VLAAVSPPQEKPSAAASGGTAQRSTKHYQCSNYSKQSSLRATRAGVAALVILEYGNMMLRIIDTEFSSFHVCTNKYVFQIAVSRLSARGRRRRPNLMRRIIDT